MKMNLIKIMKLAIRRFSEYYEIKKYRINAADAITVQNYNLNTYKIKIGNKK